MSAPLARKDWDLAVCIDTEDEAKRYRSHTTEVVSEGEFWDTVACTRCGEQFQVRPRKS